MMTTHLRPITAALVALATMLPSPSAQAPAGAAEAGAPETVEAARPLTPEQRDRLAAEQALDVARTELSLRRDALEALVLDLEDDHASLTSGPGAASRKSALIVAMVDALPAARSQVDAATAQGRFPARNARARLIAESFADPVAAASPVDTRLALWIAQRVADGLASRGRLDDVDERIVAALVDEQFEAGEGWFGFWNRRFHATLPEAEAYADAAEAYEAAGLALDRLRFPERYGPRGEQAPAGMVVVPGGSYELGPNAGYTRPMRRVSLKPFAMDRREVTQREYAVFVNSQPPGDRKAYLPRGWQLDAGKRASHPDDRANHPVVHVSWDQAAAFARWSGKRLPTEDEWEAAAAGFQGRAYPWGDGYQRGLCNGDGMARDTLPVESFPGSRSSAGCFDMAGNVWEWTATLEDGAAVDQLPDGPVNVIIRGGSWADGREKLATRYRWIAAGHATFAHPGYDTAIGFRCVRDL